jgi:hypothetical protein
MDCCVRVFYGGSVRREDGMFEDMEEELECFDEPPSFSDLCVHLKEKFSGDFTLNERFDGGKTRADYMLMPFHDHAHWSRYNRVIQGSSVAMAEVVVENGYQMQCHHEGPSFDGGTQEECGVHVEQTMGTMDLDS